jgi:peroxiredoxin
VHRTCIDTLLFYEATNHFSLKGMNTMSLIDWKEQTSRFRATLTAVEHTKQIRQSLFPSSLPRGSQAPLFTLPATTQDTLSLQSLLGKPIILAFYPADWTPVCTNQLSLYNEVLPMFASFEAQLLAISVDSLDCHHAFATAHRLRFPLLADSEPTGEISQAYGVYDERFGVSHRALFVIDHTGVVAWSHVYPYDVRPGADGILRALESLNRIPSLNAPWQATHLRS